MSSMYGRSLNGGYAIKIMAVAAAVLCISTAAVVDGSYGRPIEETNYTRMSDGTNLFWYSYSASRVPQATIYVITGYTGIDHRSEQDVIRVLSNGTNRVVVIHPRGTGYSEGKRGDVSEYRRFLQDYTELINSDITNRSRNTTIVLYGHSISCAIAMHIAREMIKVDGIILINPPYKMKQAKGMTPTIGQYLQYAAYMLCAPHTPIVDMGGDPEQIENPEERREALQRAQSPLLVRRISMYMMIESRKLMDSMPMLAADTDHPLLLIYGLSDSLVAREGCEAIFNRWRSSRKEFITVPNGPHGRQTVLMAGGKIAAWIVSL